MKVLLICLILTVGCHSNEETNTTTTTTTPTTTPKSEFESLKLPTQTNTTTSYQISTLKPEEPRNVTTEQPISFIKKKPFAKGRTQKNTYRFFNSNKFHKGKDGYHDLKKEESRSIEKKPQYNSIQISHDSHHGFIDPIKNYSIKYKVNHNFRKDGDSGIHNSKPHQNSHQSRYYPYGNRIRYSHQMTRNESEDRNPEESRQNENYVQFAYKFRALPQEENGDHENEIQPRGRGRPTLPEIQNVIHTLDSQDSTPSYKSPKENHIVEVTEVPLVFEHHYQGDYKNPDSNFVAHQYSYSPPADPTNEAYRLGKLLSQNVVQKLQADEEPLKEYIQDQQELILAGYTHGIPTYSFVNVNLNPSHVNFQKQPSPHPLMKYLKPEITPQSFSNEIRNFASPQLHPYQFVRPQTHNMQPIIVPDEDPGSEYGTTYLQAVNEHHQNQNQVTQTESSPEPNFQNGNPDTQVHENSVPNSPYSVNIHQQHIVVPKYTIANFKHNSKPQAIHEVKPPNLSGLSGSFNRNPGQYQMPAVLPTQFTDIMGNHLFNSIRTQENNKGHQEEQREHPGSEFGPPTTKLIHYVVPPSSPNTPTIVHQSRPHMVSSRPYWRRPQVMKLVRVPERLHEQQEEQNYQTQFQSYRIPSSFEDDPRTRNQHLYQSLAEHYSTPVRMQQVLRNPKQHHSNIMSLVPQQKQGERSHFNDRPIVVTENYPGHHIEEDRPIETTFSHETHQNELTEQIEHNDSPNQENVEIIKSISKYYPQLQENGQREPNLYSDSETQENRGSVLPKGYISFQPMKNVQRVPSTRHVMPMVRYRNRENFDSSRKILNPRIRRLVSDLLKDNNRRQNVYVVMTEEE